jgi:CHAD domain-containing protein
MAEAKGSRGVQRPGHASQLQSTGKDGSVLTLATDYLDRHIAELRTQGPQASEANPEAIHEMRAASRRLRSALDIYGGLFNARATQRLGNELKWLAKILGKPRDADVMRARLRKLFLEPPEEMRSDAAFGPVEDVLGAEFSSGCLQLRESLQSERYRQVLADLDEFRSHPPVTDRARRPARSEGARLVNNQARVLKRAHRAAAHALPGNATDVALHEVRKDTKRLLHASESVAGIYPKQAARLSRRAHRLQRILGSHQDSVMTRAFLDSLVADPNLPAEAQLAYDWIREVEEGIARSAVKKYATFRKKAPPLRLRR